MIAFTNPAGFQLSTNNFHNRFVTTSPKHHLRFGRKSITPQLPSSNVQLHLSVKCSMHQKDKPSTPISTIFKSLSAAMAALIVSTTLIPSNANAGINSSPLRFSPSLLENEESGMVRLRAHWDVHSIDSQTETVLMFSNDSDQVVDLWWIDYYGREVYYASINPGTMHMQPSYATHPWVVRDHISNNPVLVLVASQNPVLAVVNEV